MLLECNHCGIQVDPNDEKVPHIPPSDPSRDLFGLRCPECKVAEDFSAWKMITGDKQNSPRDQNVEQV